MEPTYSEKMQAAAQRLRTALHPQTQPEHTWTDWLISNLTPAEADLWSDMVERRVRTAVRAARMELADHVLRGSWTSGRVADVEELIHIASGGDTPENAHAVADFEPVQDVKVAIALAYENGRREGIEWAAEQQLAGRDPEVWRAES